MTRKFERGACAKHVAGVLPRAPELPDRARPPVLQVDLRRSRRDRPRHHPHGPRRVDTFEEVLQRKPKFAVIFAAGFSETGTEGKKLEQRLEGLVQSGDVRLLGPNTNLNVFEDFREDLAGPSIALITQSGHQGRPVFQGQEIGIRLTHWAPTGNEVDLEFADFARHFADQPEVGVVACYIEGFKDGRTLMLAADHAAKLRKPIVMVKVGKTEAGSSMAQSHTGHLTGSDAVTNAVFRQFGVTRRRRPRRAPRRVGRARAHPSRQATPWGAQQEGPGRRRVRDLRRHRRAHGRHAGRCRSAAPRPDQADAGGAARRAHPGVPARLEPRRQRWPARRRRPWAQDHRRDPRRQERRHPRRADHGRRRALQRTAHARTASKRRRRPTSRSS